MAYQDGDQNTENDSPRTGLKYLTERGAARSSRDRGHKSLQSEFAGARRQRSVTMSAAISALIAYSNLQSQAGATRKPAATDAQSAN